MIRVTRHDNVLKIDIETGSQWIPDEFGRDPNTRLEMRILYELADYLEKQTAAAQEAVGYRWRHSANEPWQYSNFPRGWEHQPLYAAPVAAAPGIDHLRSVINALSRNISDAYEKACQSGDEWMQTVQNARQSLLNTIREAMPPADASPKGGSTDAPVCFISPLDALMLRDQEKTLRRVRTYWDKKYDDMVPVYLGEPFAFQATAAQEVVGTDRADELLTAEMGDFGFHDPQACEVFDRAVKVISRLYAAPVAEAPGIDLSKLQRYRMASSHENHRNLYQDDTGPWVKIQDVERSLIDASPKGGSEHFQDRLAEIEGRPRPEPEVDEVEEVVACLGDDAAAMLDENPEDERALNMQRAAELLTELQAASAEVGS